jgi:AraC-like DNA-binding protein
VLTLKYLDYREDKLQGTFDFPIAFYHVESTHPRYQMPYHWHPEYEIIRILEGSFLLTVDGNLVNAGKNDILFIQGGTPHGGVPEDCSYECVVFDLRLLLSNNKICNKLIQQLLRHEIILPPKHNTTSINKAVNDLFYAMNAKKPGYEFQVQGMLYTLFGIFVETHDYSINTASGTVSSQQINRFKDVLNYIEEHYMESITLEDMALAAGLSPRYFCRFFRKMTQYTPMEYLGYYRIECACEQLAEAQQNITEIALNCGFNDISYFIKSFHKAKGVTPKQYKAAARNK